MGASGIRDSRPSSYCDGARTILDLGEILMSEMGQGRPPRPAGLALPMAGMVRKQTGPGGGMAGRCVPGAEVALGCEPTNSVSYKLVLCDVSEMTLLGDIPFPTGSRPWVPRRGVLV